MNNYKKTQKEREGDHDCYEHLDRESYAIDGYNPFVGNGHIQTIEHFYYCVICNKKFNEEELFEEDINIDNI